ncbi:cytochrome P450 [Nonomuraea sp. SYSU D8015]|uniref:cytochrome P450 n=1 Tax=Nonomuraea sp. SYSU D8015 TaxID=2593644 RepID=UPI001CB7366F|nr:cytochrome P450 [Nonomuraea sp. SYSU D8015]
MNGSVIDLMDPDQFVAGRHHEMFAWLRANDPVHWHPNEDASGFWALTTYEHVAAAYNDHATFSSQGGAMLGGSYRNEADTAAGRMLVSTDPPRHRLLRQQIHRAFAPDIVRRIGAKVAELVEAALARARAEGGCDFATEIATELPAAGLMVMVGASYAQAHELVGLTRKMIGFRDPTFVDVSDDERLRLAEIQAEMFDLFSDLIRERRRNPGDDLLSILLGAELNGRPWPEEDILYNCLNVAVGGNETSSYTACAGLLALIENPGQQAMLRADPGLVGGAVAEMVRWSSTNTYVQRVASRDVLVGGKLISKGDSVTLWNVSANRDEKQFADPGSFDITRSPNQHLSYGHGIHRCIGATVAQTELSVLLNLLMTSGLSYSLAGEISRLRSNFIQGITRLPLRIEATEQS